MALTAAIVLYDGACRVCRLIAAGLGRWDRAGALRLVAIQSAEGAALLSDLSEQERLEVLRVVDEDGRRFGGALAVAQALGRLRGGGKPAALMQRFAPVSEIVYRALASRRGALGRLVPGAISRRADASLGRRPGDVGADRGG